MLPNVRISKASSVILAALFCTTIAWHAVAYAQPQAPASRGAAISDAQAAALLAGRIKAEIATKPGTISVEDLEALMIFVVSQGAYTDDVIARALDLMEVGASPALMRATANARETLLRRKKRGTGTLGSPLGGFGAFSPPGVAPGGGSNYQ